MIFIIKPNGDIYIFYMDVLCIVHESILYSPSVCVCVCVSRENEKICFYKIHNMYYIWKCIVYAIHVKLWYCCYTPAALYICTGQNKNE